MNKARCFMVSAWATMYVSMINSLFDRSAALLFRARTTPISSIDCTKGPSTCDSPLDTFVDIILFILGFPRPLPFRFIDFICPDPHIGHTLQTIPFYSIQKISLIVYAIRQRMITNHLYGGQRLAIGCVNIWSGRCRFDSSHALHLDCTIPQ